MTDSILRGNVLVLNRNWTPINVTIVKDTVSLVYKGNANVIAHDNMYDKFGKLVIQKYTSMPYHDWVEASEFLSDEYGFIRSAQRQHFRPRIMILNHYGGYPNYYIKLSRNGIYARDDGECQYCFRSISKWHFTVDHVYPKSKGGKTSWDNLVLSCKECNGYKDDKTLIEAGMSLQKKPAKPDSYNFSKIYEKEHEYWKDFLKDKK